MVWLPNSLSGLSICLKQTFQMERRTESRRCLCLWTQEILETTAMTFQHLDLLVLLGLDALCRREDSVRQIWGGQIDCCRMSPERGA